MSAEVGAVTRLAPGTGLLARRDTALLYAPERDAELIRAFVSSPPGTELQAMASTTVAAGFGVGPFVCLAWGHGVQVMAFGDVAVETDQPSLPMLSGAGSRTWVEHSLTPTGSAVIEVTGAAGDVDDATDLTAGVALAGGFRLELIRVEADTETDPEAPPPAPPVAVPAPAVTHDGPGGAAEPAVDATTAIPLIAEVTVEPRAPDPAPALGAPPPPPGDSGEPGVIVEPHDTDMTLPPPAVGLLLGADDPDARSSLVDAKRCGQGHPNPPTAATCEVCGELLAPGATSIVHVSRPSLGRLALDDGGTVELDQELLIGRNPARDTDPARQGMRRIKLVGEKVSRSHLEIRFQGWEILVADCGSTNGTFVVPHPGAQVATLEPGRALLVEPGATVYFGSRSFAVVGRHGPRP